MLGSLLLLATSPLFIEAQGGINCTQSQFQAGQIEFSVNHLPIDLNRDVTTYELEKKLSGKLLNRNAKDNHGKTTLSSGMSKYNSWIISGAGHGDVKTNLDIEFVSIPQDPLNSKFCILFKQINLSVDYQTKMTIAKELDQDSCEFGVVMGHEMKRHDAYTKVVDSVASELKNNLPVAINTMGHSYVGGKRLPGAYKEMTQSVQDYIAVYRQQMLDLMSEYNKVIDSEEELDKLAASCKHKMIKEGDMLHHDGDPDVKPADEAKDYFSKFRDKKK